MEPFSKLCRVSEDNWKIECSGNICGPKCPLTTINEEVYGNRIRVTPRCHSLIKLDNHTRLEKLTWSHERF